jgi:hypothetical protein
VRQLADVVLSGLAFFVAAQPANAQFNPTGPIETAVVTAEAPLPGSGIDTDKVAGEVETSSAPILGATGSRTLPNSIATQLCSVNLNDEQGSQYRSDFVYCGFEASPISGVAEGIAVYQDGTRLNESFGAFDSHLAAASAMLPPLTMRLGKPGGWRCGSAGAVEAD